MDTLHFRFYQPEQRTGRSAGWGARTRLVETTADGVPLRQIDMYESAPFVDRYTVDRPVHENARGERFGQMETEPLDLEAVTSNRITQKEFDLVWASGFVRERDFGEFKWELLMSTHEDDQMVHEAWWTANGWYPHRPLSERLAFAEHALRELLAEGLVSLVRGPLDGDGEPVPRDEQDQLLRSYATWVVGEKGVMAHFVRTQAGTQALDASAKARWLP